MIMILFKLRLYIDDIKLRFKSKFWKYQYRSMPCNCTPKRLLWSISGDDYHPNHNGGGILEFCYSENDAWYLYSLMINDKDRFKNLKVNRPEEVDLSFSRIKLSDILKDIESMKKENPLFEDSNNIELYLNYGAFLNIAIKKYKVTNIHSIDESSRPAIILQTEDYISGLSKGVHY